MNDRDFRFLRILNNTDAHEMIVVGENHKDPETKKFVLGTPAYSNEVNIANAHNIACVFKQKYPNIFHSMRLRGESGRYSDKPSFRKNHSVKTRTNIKDPSSVGYDWEWVVNINGDLFIIPVFVRHRKQIFNIFTTYLTESLTKKDLKDPKKCKEIMKKHKKIIDNQIAICTVGKYSYNFDWCSCKSMANPEFTNYVAVTKDKKKYRKP